MKKFCSLILILILFSCKEEETVTVAKLPVVVTKPADEIKISSAVLHGEVISASPTSFSQGFYLAEHSGVSPSDSGLRVTESDLKYALTDLKPQTTYYFRAYAKDVNGSAMGDELSFTTLPTDVPVLNTRGITEITRTSAVSGGEITNSGTSAVTSKGICWNISGNPTINDAHTGEGSGNGTFISHITGIYPRTSYYVRAYASNAAGTGYGNERSFMTLDTTLAHPCEGLDSVAYEGKLYHTVQIGQRCWMSENLNVGEMIDGSFDMVKFNSHIEKYCYNNVEANCDLYGALYQWDELMQNVEVEGARGLCPLGWHIAKTTEWNEMITLYGGTGTAGVALKYNTNWKDGGNGTNLSGFTAQPAGSRNLDGSFSGLGENGYFWTSLRYTSDKSWRYRLDYSDQQVQSDYDIRRMGFSGRCVKD